MPNDWRLTEGDVYIAVRDSLMKHASTYAVIADDIVTRAKEAHLMPGLPEAQARKLWLEAWPHIQTLILLLSLEPLPARVWRFKVLAPCIVACLCPPCLVGECIGQHPYHPGGRRDG